MAFSASKGLKGTWKFTKVGKVFVARGRLIDVLDSAGLSYLKRESVDRSQDFGKGQADYYQMIAQYFHKAAELSSSCTVPRSASSPTRVVHTCSHESFRFNEDKEVLRPAQRMNPFKVWKHVNEYMRLSFQVREKVEAAEKNSRPPPQGVWTRPLWLWTRPLWLWTQAPKQMWSERNPHFNQSLTRMRDLFLDQLVSNCVVKTQAGFLANVPETYQIGDVVL